ncbi:MAG TPA: SAM-dependent chlorinase/fluorinase [Anaerolineales bacterium]|nr:SAM-dependent chlorinase/fluorinase [Anaerolineales bacterium]
MKTRIVAMLTDFGNLDPFAGMMKGVIAGLFPNAYLIDITHEIPPGDILRAAVSLWQAVPSFPTGTIFLAVVDPGVGTDRNPVIVRSAGNIYIGPDNGVFTLVLKKPVEAYCIEPEFLGTTVVSGTFHGRDIFAPAAALACAGETPKNFGVPVPQLTEITPPYLDWSEPSKARGEILFSDRFGNLLTSLGKFARLDEGVRFEPWMEDPAPEFYLVGAPGLALQDGTIFPLSRTYSDLPVGGCGAIIGSSGLIEIVANRGSAANALALEHGDRVLLIL